jgi:predicted DCC family thiol-disulfide oxidoreductase YuxK
MTETRSDRTKPVIVFDALCVLCAANAQFVLRHDTARRFRLASMQGETGAGLYRKIGFDPLHPDTLIIVDGDVVLRNSDAVLAIYEHCGWPWRGAMILRVIPRVVRDKIYLWIARNRYRLFGQRQSCWIPDSQDRDRVL